MIEFTPAPVPQKLEEIPAYLDAEFARLAAVLGQPKHIAPTLQNSWVNFGTGYSPAGFYKDGLGRVYLRGLLKNGTTTNGTVLFKLPKGYRPAEFVYLAAISDNAGTLQISRIVIEPDGDVAIYNVANTFLSLSGLSFVAEQ